MCKDVCVRKIRLEMCFKIYTDTWEDAGRNAVSVLELLFMSLGRSDGLLESTPNGSPGPLFFCDGVALETFSSHHLLFRSCGLD